MATHKSPGTGRGGRWRAPWGVLGLLALFAAAWTLASGAQAGGPSEYVSGDLVIVAGQTAVFENRTLVVSGNVTVEGGGILELRNSTFLLNLSSNGSLTLTVQPAGVLRLLDLDGSAASASDRSEVDSADGVLRYLAQFQVGSSVLIRNSALRGFGYSLLVPGLLVETDDATFENASIEGYRYMRVDGASPRFLGTSFTGDGTGSNYFFGSSAVLANCTFSGHLVAVSASEASSIDIGGALLRDSGYALAANGSTVRVRDSAVNNTSAGIFLTNASTVELTEVLFDPGLISFGDAASRLESARSFTFLLINGAGQPVRNATVLVRDGANATVAQGVTGTSGAFGPVALLAFEVNASGRADAANYSVFATRAANVSSAAFSALSQPSPITLLLPSNLDPSLALVSPPSGAVLLAGYPEPFVVNATDPDATPGGLTVTWRSSLSGDLGSGASLSLALAAGTHVIEVEARDREDGLRRISFNVTVEAGRAETQTIVAGNLTYRVTLWKTSQGAFGLLLGAPSGAPALAVGDALLVFPRTGSITWGWALLEMDYDPGALPYGTGEANLTLRHEVAGAWQPVAGVAVNTSLDVLSANVTRSAGLGEFALFAVKGANEPPSLPALPRLVAVWGQSFDYRLDAVDTPGDTVTFAVEGAPAWLALDAVTGALAGTPSAADRGLLRLTVTATDQLGASAAAPLEIFVTGSTENRLPQLVNPFVLPANPASQDAIVIQVTYFDADDDLPLVLEVSVDGQAHAMEPVNLYDINVSDGKDYAFRTTLPAGRHTLAFRTNDAAPGHTDVVISAGDIEVSPGARQLDNWFLALFASIALTLALMLYASARAPARPKAVKAPPGEPEDRLRLLSGDDLKPIPPAPAPEPAARSRSGDLEKEADALAREAEEDEERAAESLRKPGRGQG